ncbi:cadmium-translocating P-type ATPase [Shinella sp. WSJ-2]|uniref:heavy metal translocating P-type ATPase n=1 Tax=Shinella sp. WSJ-2 TaxID=2303749 RepID=UPI000E3C8C40|nr:heavy metal translocating P-type ATPase [Shinella sp. WSJ-2]RFZ83914.1 cadmium-translocating P-type ATPase [Shinella sp. WSJ-2]
MSCCSAEIGLDISLSRAGCSADELAIASRDLGNGLRQSVLSIPTMHCAACIGAVESILAEVPGVERARANLSLRRVTIDWRRHREIPPDLLGALASIGYQADLPTAEIDGEDKVFAGLVRALAVAGFCSMNIMLLSVSVWSGADTETRQAFHAISALLALPAVFYSGAGFYRSAWQALSHRRTNMDVPISVGILLTFALSLYDTITDAPHAYFEAATSLIFVLLIGRVLDRAMRQKARSAVAALTRLIPRGASVVQPDGRLDYVELAEIKAGMRLAIATGERVPTDGVVKDGSAELDAALITGESLWRSVRAGGSVRAGELNLGNPFVLRATAAPADSTVAEMTRMIEAAENGRSRFRRLADRAASLYAPVVHSLAALAFVAWFLATGNLHAALTVAVAVLIITCPCALGLAVPMVQVMLARRLFERGVMATDGSAFERLREIDTVVFDKTGTLTTGMPRLANLAAIAPEALGLAAGLAHSSSHPVAHAIAAAANSRGARPAFADIREEAGVGLEGRLGDDLYRLGRAEWALSEQDMSATTVLSKNGEAVAHFHFSEDIRCGARDLVRTLKDRRLDVILLSGDSRHAVETVAGALGIADRRARLLPAEKVQAVKDLQAAGRRVLMIGDGINDAPALRAADASMAPTSASDVGRSAADFVFLGNDLRVVTDLFDSVERAARLIRQNFALAFGYNAVALPIAIAGYVTPLIAALAMSSSSVLVVVNALRLRMKTRPENVEFSVADSAI